MGYKAMDIHNQHYGMDHNKKILYARNLIVQNNCVYQDKPKKYYRTHHKSHNVCMCGHKVSSSHDVMLTAVVIGSANFSLVSWLNNQSILLELSGKNSLSNHKYLADLDSQPQNHCRHFFFLHINNCHSSSIFKKKKG